MDGLVVQCEAGIAARLRAAREAKGLSVRGASRLSGVAASTIRRVERLS